MRLAVPDCRAIEEAFYLTPELRRELILLIAEKGEAGIDEFVRRHEKDDSTIARRIARIRQRLLDEAAELRRRLRTQYDEARDAERERLRSMLDRLHREEKEIRDREKQWAARLPREVEAAVRSLPLLDIAITPRRLSWHARAWNAVRRFFGALWFGLLRLLGLAKAPSGKARAIAFGVPGLSGPGVTVDVDLEQALRNPEMRRRIRQKMGETWTLRARRMWRILIGLEDYREVAQRIMEEEAKRAAESKGGELQREADRLEQERKARERLEAEGAKAADEEIARLDAAQALEEERLRASLAARPAEDVRELVQVDLEASALVERIGGDLRVTGRFLERLAAVVYAEEAKGLGSTNESPIGSTIEGEGILERTPLLSSDETSHMDTATSLLNARTRHPHVRHLLEEDVVVYRERRASLTHVVLIMDKSLSMEENDRMGAAKRAILALHHGTRARGAQNRIDVLLMDTSVVRANLSQAWAAKPGGFTNTGRALEAARALLKESRATRKLLFLVTDGLPEALTIEGKDVAGRPQEAMIYAVRQAERLRTEKGLSTTIVLLEPKDPLFVQAGEKLAKAARGKVVKVQPAELTRSLLVEMREQAFEAPRTA